MAETPSTAEMLLWLDVAERLAVHTASADDCCTAVRARVAAFDQMREAGTALVEAVRGALNSDIRDAATAMHAALAATATPEPARFAESQSASTMSADALDSGALSDDTPEPVRRVDDAAEPPKERN